MQAADNSLRIDRRYIMADGGKNKKYGRGKRAPSGSQQVQRTAKNKARNIKKAASASGKVLAVPRGTARAKRRVGA